MDQPIFETGPLSVIQAGLELTMQPRMASNFQHFCLSIRRAGNTGLENPHLLCFVLFFYIFVFVFESGSPLLPRWPRLFYKIQAIGFPLLLPTPGC